MGIDQIEELEKLIFPKPVKTEKRLFIFFFWTSLVPIILLFIAGYYVTANIQEKEAFSKQTALAEQRHSELALFVEKIQTKTASWGTDGRIRNLTEKIDGGECARQVRATCPVAVELSNYLSKDKIPLDPSVGIIDILSVDGIVVASSEIGRIGIDESEQKTTFEETKMLPFGQATFFPELVTEEEEFDGRLMVHLSAPIASTDNKRLVGVLLAHTENKELNEIVAENIGQTTESYIVNKDRLMVTPSRFIPGAVLNQEVITPPVNACIEHNVSFSGAYKDYRGVEVFGASVCDSNLFGTLIVETDKEEVFIEINRLRNTASAILAVVLILILGYAYLSGTDIVRGARHIFPGTVSSTITLSIVIGIIVISTIGISFVFARNIEHFIINQKVDIISSLVSQQAGRHIDGSPVSTFVTWDTPDAQKRFADFSSEVLRSFHSVAAIQLHTPSGILVWSSLQNAKVGTHVESAEVSQVLRTGEVTMSASTSTVHELGVPTLIEIYVPILGESGQVVGITEAYLNTGDIGSFTQNIQQVLWVGAFIALVLVFLLLRYVFRLQDAKIVSQSAELAGVIEQSPIGIYTVMKDGTIETSNPAMVRESGQHDVAEIVGKNVFNIKHYEDSGLADLIRGGLDGVAFRKEVEISSYEHGGKKAYHHYYGVPLRNSDGEVDHLLLMSEDITERKDLENKVQEYTKVLEQKVTERTKDIEEARAKAEALLASLGEGMIATNNEGEITTVNRVAEKMLGWSFEEVKGKLMTEVVPAVNEQGEDIPREKRVCLLAAADENTKTLTDMMYFVRRDGSRVPVAVTATHVFIKGENTGAVVIFRDITAENEIEKTRRDLLSLASHQLRTPLSGTKWLIETLRKGIHGTLTKNQQEYLDEIYKINVRMTTLVHDMLGVLRIEGDLTPAKIEEISVSDIFASVSELLGSAAVEKKIILKFIGDESDTVVSDQSLLQSIMESLVSNAIHYSPEESEIIISAEKSGSDTILTVKDHGIGIPKNEQRQIFERFYRASNAKTYDTHGSGLGLYITATLAKKIGAVLSFESEKDKGSTFSVRIPLAKP